MAKKGHLFLESTVTKELLALGPTVLWIHDFCSPWPYH